MGCLKGCLIFVVGIICVVAAFVAYDTIRTRYLRRNQVYFDYEAAPGLWPHNDSMFMLIVTRVDDLSLKSVDLNTDEAWRIVSQEYSEPTGSCYEHMTMREIRQNGLVFDYEFFLKRSYDWVMEHDLIRPLYDQQYFHNLVTKAEAGDHEAQTVVGSCYGHCGANVSRYIKHDEDKAFYWWRKAAEAGYKYAIRELTVYYIHRRDYENAEKWYEKGDFSSIVLDQRALFRKLQENDDEKLEINDSI